MQLTMMSTVMWLLFCDHRSSSLAPSGLWPSTVIGVGGLGRKLQPVMGGQSSAMRQGGKRERVWRRASRATKRFILEID